MLRIIFNTLVCILTFKYLLPTNNSKPLIEVTLLVRIIFELQVLRLLFEYYHYMSSKGAQSNNILYSYLDTLQMVNTYQTIRIYVMNQMSLTLLMLICYLAKHLLSSKH